MRLQNNAAFQSKVWRSLRLQSNFFQRRYGGKEKKDLWLEQSNLKEPNNRVFRFSKGIASRHLFIQGYLIRCARQVRKFAFCCRVKANLQSAAWRRVRFYETRAKKERHSVSVFLFLVTRTGIEPMFPAWEASVLTAWPTGRAFHSFVIISWPCFFVNTFFEKKIFLFQKICLVGFLFTASGGLLSSIWLQCDIPDRDLNAQ